MSLVPIRHKLDQNKFDNKQNISTLPEIEDKKLKKINSVVDNLSRKSKISHMDSHKGMVQNPEIGASFVSFNIANSELKNTSALYNHNIGKIAEKSDKIKSENHSRINANESFESWTTEGKKAEIILEFGKIENASEDSYGLSQNFAINENQRDNSSVKESSKLSKRTKSVFSHGSNSSDKNWSLPEIQNSVVDDVLPFKGLENHYKPISKEGFSGANETSQMKKTNENFYSSMRSK